MATEGSIINTFTCPECGAKIMLMAVSRLPGPEPGQAPKTMADMQKLLGADVGTALYLQEEPDYFTVSPIKYLGKEKWSDIHRTLLAVGGSWLSLDKNSCWKVPKSHG